MINVDRIKRFVELISNKNQNGQFTVDRFNLALQQAEQELFNEYYGLPNRSLNGRTQNDMFWESNEKTKNTLRPFIKKTSLIINSNGEATVPLDFVHASSMRTKYIKESIDTNENNLCNTSVISCDNDSDCYKYFNEISTIHIARNDFDKEVEVEQVRDMELGQRLSSSIISPSRSYPIYISYDSYFQFYPSGVGIATLTYLRKPRKSIWNFTSVNNRPIYDSSTSIDSEFGEECLNEIVMRICNYLGINLSNTLLMQYSDKMQQEGS